VLAESSRRQVEVLSVALGRIHHCAVYLMSAADKFERDCAYCRQPIRLKWKKRLIPPEGVCLVADQVFHDECWDRYWTKYAPQSSSGQITVSSAIAASREA
jgi:hypothetical protein